MHGSGRAVIECITSNGGTRKLLLRHALYAPAGRCNLLSLSKILSNGRITIGGSQSGIILYEDDKEVGNADADHGLYRLNVTNTPPRVDS